MKVRVKLYASLRKHLPEGFKGDALDVDLEPNATVADIIARLGFPPDHAGMIVSGDEHLDLSTPLHDGQEVNLFPPLAGGW